MKSNLGFCDPAYIGSHLDHLPIQGNSRRMAALLQASFISQPGCPPGSQLGAHFPARRNPQPAVETIQSKRKAFIHLKHGHRNAGYGGNTQRTGQYGTVRQGTALHGGYPYHLL